MAQQHLDVMHRLIDYHKDAEGIADPKPLRLSREEVNDLLEIFEKLGLCTKDGKDVGRA